MAICTECINYCDETACTSALNLLFDNVNATSLTLYWDGSANATSFSIEYRVVGSTTWLVLPAVAPGTSSATITGLTADTQYEFRLNTICASTNCYSLVVRETTLTA